MELSFERIELSRPSSTGAAFGTFLLTLCNRRTKRAQSGRFAHKACPQAHACRLLAGLRLDNRPAGLPTVDKATGAVAAPARFAVSPRPPSSRISLKPGRCPQPSCWTTRRHPSLPMSNRSGGACTRVQRVQGGRSPRGDLGGAAPLLGSRPRRRAGCPSEREALHVGVLYDPLRGSVGGLQGWGPL